MASDEKPLSTCSQCRTFPRIPSEGVPSASEIRQVQCSPIFPDASPRHQAPFFSSCCRAKTSAADEAKISHLAEEDGKERFLIEQHARPCLDGHEAPADIQAARIFHIYTRKQIVISTWKSTSRRSVCSLLVFGFWLFSLFLSCLSL